MELIERVFQSLSEDTFGRDFEQLRRCGLLWFTASLLPTLLLKAIKSLGYTSLATKGMNVEGMSGALVRIAIQSGLYPVANFFCKRTVELLDFKHVAGGVKCVLSTNEEYLAHIHLDNIALFSLPHRGYTSIRGPLILPSLNRPIRFLCVDDTGRFASVTAVDVDGTVHFLRMQQGQVRWIDVRQFVAYSRSNILSMSARDHSIYLGFEGCMEVITIDPNGFAKPTLTFIYHTGICHLIRAIANTASEDAPKVIVSSKHPKLSPEAHESKNSQLTWNLETNPNFYNAKPFHRGDFYVYLQANTDLTVGCVGPAPTFDFPTMYHHFVLQRPAGENAGARLFAVTENHQYGTKIAAMFGETLVVYAIAPDVLEGIKLHQPEEWGDRRDIIGVKVLDGYETTDATLPLRREIEGMVVASELKHVEALKLIVEGERTAILAFSSTGLAHVFTEKGIPHDII